MASAMVAASSKSTWRMLGILRFSSWVMEKAYPAPDKAQEFMYQSPTVKILGLILTQLKVVASFTFVC